MDFSDYVDQIEGLYLAGLGAEARKAYGEQPSPALELPRLPRRILLIAPHPDDECLMAGFPLRAQEEWGASVGVLAYGYGSDPTRQEARRKELKNSLQVLGFEEVFHESGTGLSERILAFGADAIVIPNRRDFHPTHIRCSEESWHAAQSAVARSGQPILVLETEYWGPMENPNLLIPLPPSVVKKMGRALMCHEGEIARNPYHLSLPAFLMDQQRRGSEAVSGFGQKPVPSIFAQVYRATELSPEVGS